MANPRMDELLEHAYDGIQEYDNPTPQWWNWSLIASIVFSIFYFSYYHIFGGTSVAEAYAQEMKVVNAQKAKEKAARGAVTEEQLQAILDDPSKVAAGKAVFDANCVACHKAQGEGLIGPNLTDACWKNGDGTLVAIHKVIDEGVVEKGMAAWGKVLKPDQVNEATAYVGTLRGKNVPGKPCEGKKIGG